MGDALSMALLERRGFTVEDFAVLHPGGRLGKKLLRVEDLMHTGDDIPRVLAQTPMSDVLFEMTRKRLGLTTVTDEDGTLLGVISDGDLRRQMERHGNSLFDRTAAECMTHPAGSGRPQASWPRRPSTCSSRARSRRCSSSTGRRRIEGVLHLHDLWKTEMI